MQSKLIKDEMIKIQDMIASNLHQKSTKQNPTDLVPRSVLSPSICQHGVRDNHRGHTNSMGLDIIGFIRENTGVQSYFEATQNVVVIKGFFCRSYWSSCTSYTTFAFGTALYVFLRRHFVIDKLLLMSFF